MKKLKKSLKVILCSLLILPLLYFSSGQVHADDGYIVVQKGDTLYGISRLYHLTVAELKEYNDLRSNTIYIGQKLYIPNLEPSKAYYIVNAGSFTKKSNAEKRVALLKKSGIEALIVKRTINEKIFYRTQAGVFSSKSNAVALIKKIKGIGIYDAYLSTEKSLHINNISIGATYNQLLNQFGKPTKTEDQQSTIRSLFYGKEGAGVRVTFNMENGTIHQLQVYPEYANFKFVPTKKNKVLEVYGNPNEIKIVSCYETATCEQLIYQFNGKKLMIQIDRDGKTVQYLDLSSR